MSGAGTPRASPPGWPAELPEPIRWTADGAGLVILDQTALPTDLVERELRDAAAVEEAIRSLRVRGAPLIGITAAMGVAALARAAVERAGVAGRPLEAEELRRRLEGWCERLEGARPTAVNLTWALDRLRRRAAEPEVREARSARERAAERRPDTGAWLAARLRAEAERILEEDRAACRCIGEHAVALLRDGGTVITHCNAGALATGGIGTALAPIYVAVERGLRVRVYADETRPLLQGSRLTAWELERAGVEVTVIADNAAGALMASEPPDAVLVGADRIAANGDTANKIGTYGLAVLAERHRIPFYVLAPTSTIDPGLPSGATIPLEHRAADEVRKGFGTLTAPPGSAVWSPAFDVTPAHLIAAIITERGIHRPPYERSLAEALAAGRAEPRPEAG